MEDLIERWVRGDARAAEELYYLYGRRVEKFALTLGQSPLDAEEIAHEAIAAGLEGLRAGRQPRRFTHWLLGIARKISARRAPLEVDDMSGTLDEVNRSAKTQVVRQEMNALLERTLSELPRKDRELLDLLHRSSFSRKQVAESLGVSHESIHARCERLYGRLRGELSCHFTTLFLSRAGRPPLTLAAILKLRPAFRAAVIARHLEELSETAAAAKLAIPAATLRARLQSGYEMLGCDPDDDWTPARREWKSRKGEQERRDRP
jgi:RNA polymerase sigma factor (sigma-70 family)